MKKLIKHRYFPIAIIAIAGLIFWAIMRFIAFDGLYGQDAYEYARYTTELRKAVNGKIIVGDFFWPVIYPIASLIPDLLINDVTWSLQLVSIISWVLILFTSLKILTSLFPKVNKHIHLLFVVIFIGLSPYMIRLGASGMSDMLCTLFVTLCFRYYLDERQNSKLLYVILFGVLAFQTRYGAIVIVGIPIIHSTINVFKRKQYRLIPLLLMCLIIPTLPYLFLKGFNFGHVLNKSVASDWNLTHFFQRTFEGNEGRFSYDFPNIVYAFFSFYNPAFLFIGAPLILVMLAKKIKWNLKIIIPVLIYSFFIAGLHFQNKRFLILGLPLIAIALYPAFLYLIEKVKSIQLKVTTLGVFALLNIGFAIYSFRVIYLLQQQDLKVAAWISKYNASNIYTFELDVSLKGRGSTSNFTNLWLEKNIQPKTGDYLLLNEVKWQKQWRHHLLMENCKKLHENHTLMLKDSLDSGWKLYIVE